ncbi:MAG TPA: hypothetical protein VD978_11115 [Azospirillum sp.]|nr:hypothetical protein [Azospirillum sp.]
MTNVKGLLLGTAAACALTLSVGAVAAELVAKGTSDRGSGAPDVVAAPVAEPVDRTVVVTAEGLADPKAPQYARDKGVMVDDLRRDARRSVIEKAVGTMVDASTLIENYTVVNDRVLTKSEGVIKRIVKESDPWMGEDGFMHLMLRAEVSLLPVEQALKEMSQQERKALLRENGDPKISVAVLVSDADRGSEVEPQRSAIAENILKERMTSFGYRVWSEKSTVLPRGREGAAGSHGNRQSRESDYTIIGEAKFKPLKAVLPASGKEITRHALTSWTVVAVDNQTGEEVYVNNKVPQARAWNDEDAALSEIGGMIGTEFGRDFFRERVAAPARIMQLQIEGLPDYDTGTLIRKELLGLRPVLDADFRDYDGGGVSNYEVNFAGGRGAFTQLVNDAVVAPLNQKLGEKAFRLVKANGAVVRLAYGSKTPENLANRLAVMPPASLVTAAPERLAELAASPETKEKIAVLTKPPAAVGAMNKF